MVIVGEAQGCQTFQSAFLILNNGFNRHQSTDFTSRVPDSQFPQTEMARFSFDLSSQSDMINQLFCVGKGRLQAPVPDDSISFLGRG